MHKWLSVILALSLVGLASPVLAQTASTTDTQQLIQSLQAQVKTLGAQVTSLKAQLESTNQQLTTIKTELNISRSLARGATGDDVKALQSFLAQYPDLYPEGLITGYFGSKTEAAVRKLQEQNGIASIGIVGPKTLSRLNELFSATTAATASGTSSSTGSAASSQSSAPSNTPASSSASTTATSTSATPAPSGLPGALPTSPSLTSSSTTTTVTTTATSTTSTPSAPPQLSQVQGLAATVSGTNGTSVTLSWQAATVYVYYLYRGSSPDFTPSLVGPHSYSALRGNMLSYTDSDLSAGTYYYKIAAVDVNGVQGPASQSVSAVIAPVPPTKPAVVSYEGADGTWCYNSNAHSPTIKSYCQDNTGTYGDSCNGNVADDYSCYLHGIVNSSGNTVSCARDGYTCSGAGNACSDGACIVATTRNTSNSNLAAVASLNNLGEVLKSLSNILHQLLKR